MEDLEDLPWSIIEAMLPVRDATAAAVACRFMPDVTRRAALKRAAKARAAVPVRVDEESLTLTALCAWHLALARRAPKFKQVVVHMALVSGHGDEIAWAAQLPTAITPTLATFGDLSDQLVMEVTRAYVRRMPCLAEVLPSEVGPPRWAGARVVVRLSMQVFVGG